MVYWLSLMSLLYYRLQIRKYLKAYLHPKLTTQMVMKLPFLK